MSDSHDTGTAAGAAPDLETDGWAPVVPYFDLEVQRQIEWRDGDIVISVPIKSGTTWTMNIVHQLRSGGDPDFDDIYVEVPWLELATSREATRADLVERFDSMPADVRRAFKTHAGIDQLPYFRAGEGRDVRYLVVLRNPDEVLASFYPFMQSMSPEWHSYWGTDTHMMQRPDFQSFFETVGKMMIPGGLFGFLSAWWPLRHEPNVLLMHFSDMKRDHEGSVRRIADFLGFAPTAAQMENVLEYTSFRWMKAHEDKFEARLASAVPILNPGGMVRKGGVGTAREDGVTAAMSAELRSLGEQQLTDPQALEWLYAGGRLD